jgi:hypothetical protein
MRLRQRLEESVKLGDERGQRAGDVGLGPGRQAEHRRAPVARVGNAR